MLQVYKAQTDNVRRLASSRRILNRFINNTLVSGDDAQCRVLTRLLCVTFSCWAEAQFSKLINTPYGFDDNEIARIKRDASGRDRSVEERWRECIHIALSKVSSSRRSNELPNTKQRLDRIVEKYVVSPSRVRNKIAHGQWSIALNRENDAVNNDATAEIELIDVIEIELWFEVFAQLIRIIENMIESPNNAHRSEYWNHVVEIESIENKWKFRTLAAKQTQLRTKRAAAAAKWAPEIEKQRLRAKG